MKLTLNNDKTSRWIKGSHLATWAEFSAQLDGNEGLQNFSKLAQTVFGKKVYTKLTLGTHDLISCREVYI